MEESKRQQKYARQILKDLGEVFQKNPNHYFGNNLVTLTGTEVSPDLGFVKCYFSVLPEKNAEEVMLSLNEKKSEVRKHLGNIIGKRVRIVPALAFFMDNTEVSASEMNKLIDSLVIPPADDTEED
ncbi:MAG: ribosome-binding factor A [Cyclobacteriaceae bacterium]|jgi:ribosome-binding factor A